MTGRRGGISIFLAVTFLSLIIFVTSIVEVTRYQILRAQAERMVISATQSVLAGYDSALKNEYGIFARNPDYSDWSFLMPGNAATYNMGMEQDFYYYLSQNTNQSVNDMDLSLVDRIVFGRERESYYQTAPLTMTSVTFETEETLVPDVLEDLDYVKGEMVDYMTARLPMMALKPILESFGAAEKLGKTTEFIEGKNEQIEKAASIESRFLKLYEYIDGVVIDESTGSISISDTNYMNRLMVAVDRTYLREHMPDDINVGSTFKVYEIMETYEQKFTSLEGYISGLCDLGKKYDESESEINALTVEIGTLEIELTGVELSLKNLNRSISDLKDLDELSESQKTRLKTYETRKHNKASSKTNIKLTLMVKNNQKVGLEADLRSLSREIESKISGIEATQTVIDDCIDQLAMLTEDNTGYLAVAEVALEDVISIREEGQELAEGIDSFLGDAEASKDSYISSTYDQSTLELEAIKNSYAGDGDDYKIKNNLERIEDTLENNIGLLTNQSANVDLLTSYYSKYLIGSMKEDGLTKTDISELITISGMDVNFYDDYLAYDSWQNTASSDGLYSAVKELVSGLDGYSGGSMLDYSGYSTMMATTADAQEDKENAENQLSLMKTFIEKYSLTSLLGSCVPQGIDLPDGLISEDLQVSPQAEAGAPDTDYDIDAYKTGESTDDDQVFMDEGKKTDGMTLIQGIKDQLLINEYAVQMFRSFPDGNRDDPETLAGYSKADRDYETELEYIYTGIKDSKMALGNVVFKIFALRVAFNSIHLATDTAKRTMIINLATMIAGWWTAGIGTLILSLIIGLLWATVESLYDIKLLLDGEKVPLLKTSVSWITSPAGIGQIVMEDMTDAAVNAVSSTVTALSDKAKESLEGYEDQLGDEVKKVIDTEVTELFQTAEEMAAFLVADMEQAYVQAIDSVLGVYLDGKEAVKASDYFSAGTDEYALLGEMMTHLEDLLDNQVDLTYSKAIELKQQVLTQYSEKIETLKEKVISETTEATGKMVTTLFDKMEEEVEAMTKKGQEVTENYIRNKMATIKGKVSDKTKALDTGVAAQKSKLDKSVMIPSVSYEMYLRLFMMIAYNELDERVARMLDLIDYNLARERVGSGGSVTYDDLNLRKYAVAVSGQCHFSLPYMFIDLPVSSFKENPGDNNYTIWTWAVNGYE